MPSETCDDGNKFDNIGCSPTCISVLSGWICTSGNWTHPSICTSICGDGLLLNAETCDDGNWLDNRGCRTDC